MTTTVGTTTTVAGLPAPRGEKATTVAPLPPVGQAPSEGGVPAAWWLRPLQAAPQPGPPHPSSEASPANDLFAAPVRGASSRIRIVGGFGAPADANFRDGGCDLAEEAAAMFCTGDRRELVVASVERRRDLPPAASPGEGSTTFFSRQLGSGAGTFGDAGSEWLHVAFPPVAGPGGAAAAARVAEARPAWPCAPAARGGSSKRGRGRGQGRGRGRGRGWGRRLAAGATREGAAWLRADAAGTPRKRRRTTTSPGDAPEGAGSEPAAKRRREWGAVGVNRVLASVRSTLGSVLRTPAAARDDSRAAWQDGADGAARSDASEDGWLPPRTDQGGADDAGDDDDEEDAAEDTRSAVMDPWPARMPWSPEKVCTLASRPVGASLRADVATLRALHAVLAEAVVPYAWPADGLGMTPAAVAEHVGYHAIFFGGLSLVVQAVAAVHRALVALEAFISDEAAFAAHAAWRAATTAPPPVFRADPAWAPTAPSDTACPLPPLAVGGAHTAVSMLVAHLVATLTATILRLGAQDFTPAPAADRTTTHWTSMGDRAKACSARAVVTALMSPAESVTAYVGAARALMRDLRSLDDFVRDVGGATPPTDLIACVPTHLLGAVPAPGAMTAAIPASVDFPASADFPAPSAAAAAATTPGTPVAELWARLCAAARRFRDPFARANDFAASMCRDDSPPPLPPLHEDRHRGRPRAPEGGGSRASRGAAAPRRGKGGGWRSAVAPPKARRRGAPRGWPGVTPRGKTPRRDEVSAGRRARDANAALSALVAEVNALRGGAGRAMFMGAAASARALEEWLSSADFLTHVAAFGGLIASLVNLLPGVQAAARAAGEVTVIVADAEDARRAAREVPLATVDSVRDYVALQRAVPRDAREYAVKVHALAYLRAAQLWAEKLALARSTAQAAVLELVMTHERAGAVRALLAAVRRACAAGGEARPRECAAATRTLHRAEQAYMPEQSGLPTPAYVHDEETTLAPAPGLRECSTHPGPNVRLLASTRSGGVVRVHLPATRERHADPLVRQRARLQERIRRAVKACWAAWREAERAGRVVRAVWLGAPAAAGVAPVAACPSRATAAPVAPPTFAAEDVDAGDGVATEQVAEWLRDDAAGRGPASGAGGSGSASDDGEDDRGDTTGGSDDEGFTLAELLGASVWGA